MSITQRLLAFAALPALLLAQPAAALDFSGAMMGQAVVGPNAGCAPIPFQGVISAGTGSSALGNFTYSHTVCTQGTAGGPIVGNYTVDFGPDQFVGSLLGASAPSGTPMLSNLLINYVITGGTGRFIGATGNFTGAGTANTTTRPSVVSLVFTPVPEPRTWALMLLGFAGIGSALRRRRPKRPLPQVA